MALLGLCDEVSEGWVGVASSQQVNTGSLSPSGGVSALWVLDMLSVLVTTLNITLSHSWTMLKPGA